jgi:septal ring factor EnvC (AmiA/AmiB activator)
VVYNRLIAILAAAYILFLPLYVAGQVRLVTIAQPVRVAGDPASVLLVVASDEKVIGVAPALVVGGAANESSSVVGRLAVPIDAERLHSIAVVISKTGEVSSGFRQIPAISEEPVLLLDKGSVEERLSEQRETLARWEAQVRAQQASMTRLQEDADAIANVNRIVDAEDELSIVKREAQRLKAALALASGRVNSLKAQTVPTNFKRREMELSDQLNELSTALKTKEASALERIAVASSELRKNLQLIEETKGKQIDVLNAELARLRKRREGFEREFQSR